jgi:hypothetical protein
VESVTPTELWIKPFLFPSAKFSLKGTFDATDPNLVAFTPDGNTVTCSNGHCLLTYVRMVVIKSVAATILFENKCIKFITFPGISF